MAFGGKHGKRQFCFFAKLIITMKNSSNANTRQCCCVSKNGIHNIEDGTVEFHFDE